MKYNLTNSMLISKKKKSPEEGTQIESNINEKKTIRVLLSTKGKTQILLTKFNNSTSWKFPEFEVNPKDNLEYIVKQIEMKFLKIPLVGFEKKFKSKLINISYNYDKLIKKNKFQNKLTYQYVIVYTNHRILDHLNLEAYEWIPWTVAIDYFKVRNDVSFSVLNEAITYMEYYHGIFNSKVHSDVVSFLDKITFDDYKKIRYYLENSDTIKIIKIIKDKLDDNLKDFPLILKEDYLETHSNFIHNKLSNLILRSV